MQSKKVWPIHRKTKKNSVETVLKDDQILEQVDTDYNQLL